MLFHFSIKQRIYGIVGLSFCGLIGLAATQASYLGDALHDQRQQELKHLAQLAVGIAREEYDAAQREHTPDPLARQKAAERIGQLRYGNGDYFWINDLGPRMVMHPAKPELNGQDLTDIKDPTGKHLFVAFADTVRRQGSGFVDYQWPKPGKDAPQPKLSYVTGFEPWGWVIGTGVYVDDLQAQLWSNLKMVIAAALLVMGLLGTTTLLIARKISTALVSMTAALTELGEGNFDVKLPGLDRADELGAMARSIEQFKLKAAEKARADAAIEDERRAAAERVRADALNRMAETVERETHVAVGAVASGTERMATSARLMSDSALTLEQNSGSVAAAAEEALANAETVAQASAHMASSIAEIAAQVSSSRALTLTAVTASTEAQSTIAKLSEAASKVGAVTNLINEIAGQTNLLALNATIEAARAGEAGRGFAVVASEVKSLAEQTARATSEIAQQITEIQDSTKASVGSISAIGEAIRNVEAVSATIARAIEEQNAATSEISRTVEQTSQAAREVAAQIASVSREAGETGRRAAEIRDGSAEIAGKVDDLRTTLVRVIRTSTSDVDRRMSSRVAIQRPGTLRVSGKRYHVTVRDLSSEAAMIDGISDRLAIDSLVNLSIGGVPDEISGRIVRVDGGAALVRLELTGNQQRQLDSLMSVRTAA